jgi:hypothetical protein
MSALWALVVLAVLLLIGAPVALSIPGSKPEWTGFAFEAVVIGLLVEMLVAIGLLHAGWYHPLGVLAASAVVVGGATFGLRRWGRRPSDLSGLRGVEAALVGAGVLVLVGAALAIRHAPSYFIFQTGDMGDYVNTANMFRQGTSLRAAQPQGFTVFLSGTNLLLGEARTVAGLPALGTMLLLGAVAVTRALRLHVVATLGVAIVLLVHPVAVWFSLFPVSEALSAGLMLALFYFLVRARATQSTAYAVIGGLVAGSLLLVRGEAMLVAPIVVVVLLASVAVDDRSTVRVQQVFTFTALVALFAAYAYDVTYEHRYFVSQLSRLVPDAASRFAEDARLVEVSVPLVAAGAVALAAVFALVRIVDRVGRPRVSDRPVLFWQSVNGAVVAIAALAALSFSLHGLKNSGQRWGAVLLVLVAIGAVGVIARPGRYVDAASGLLLLLVLGVFVVLFARRVPQPQVHAYYLYFDRYLFSEVWPVALPLAAVGIQMVADACTRAPARVVPVALAGLVVVIAAGLVPQARETRRVTEHRLFGESYDAVRRLDRLTRSQGHAGDVVYSGSKTRPAEWFYPNTYRALALPLRQSFDRTVYGIPHSAIAPDQVFTPRAARSVLRENGASSGYLVQLRPEGAGRIADDDHTRWVGSVDYTVPLLEQHPVPPAAPWTFPRLLLDVYALRGDGRPA